MKHLFYDDYSEGMHPALLEYISANNDVQTRGYGEDEFCELAAQRINAALGTSGDVHFVPGGGAANQICLSAMLRSFEGVIAPATGHINVHEAGAIEATGHKVIAVESVDGKLTPDLIDKGLATHENEHTVRPRIAYFTQQTEMGTVFSKKELTDGIAYAKSKGLLTYLDGARLAMAIGANGSDCTLKDVGSVGFDMIYLGGTKVGGAFGEAIVVLNDDFRKDFRYFIKQRGALLAKGRFLGQQFARFFDEDQLWLQLGRQAADNGLMLAAGFREKGVRFFQEPVTNQVFVIWPKEKIAELQKEFGFYSYYPYDEKHEVARFVTSWATPEAAIKELVEAV